MFQDERKDKMNLKKVGMGALIVLTPLLNGCKKATETISIKNGQKYLTEETVKLFAEKYAKIDTLIAPVEMSRAVADSVKLTIKEIESCGIKISNIRTGINSKGKPFFVYSADYSTGPGTCRVADQLTEDGKFERKTYFDNSSSPSRSVVIRNSIDPMVEYVGDKIDKILIGENTFDATGKFIKNP